MQRSHGSVNIPLTATLMPRLPPLFFSSMIKCSAVFKLMMDGDLEHASYKQVRDKPSHVHPRPNCIFGNRNLLGAGSHLGVVYPHHGDVESLAHFGGCHAGQVDGLLQLFHGGTVLGAAQRGLRAETPLQRQAQSALTEGSLAVL